MRRWGGEYEEGEGGQGLVSGGQVFMWLFGFSLVYPQSNLNYFRQKLCTCFESKTSASI